MSILNKIKTTKLSLKVLKDGNALLKSHDTGAKDFDDQWLVRSHDMVYSFPITVRAIMKGQDKFLIHTSNKVQVFYGLQGEYFNREYCESNNIPMTPFPTQGGAVIFSHGDLAMSFITKNTGYLYNWLGYIRPKIVEYIQRYGVDCVTLQNNDILCGGKKISGASTTVKRGVTLESLFIAANNNQEFVDGIGHKDSQRQVCGLTDFGIDPQEFAEWLINETEEFYKASKQKQQPK